MSKKNPIINDPLDICPIAFHITPPGKVHCVYKRVG